MEKYLFPHPGWIAARAPNRENSQKMTKFCNFLDFFGPWKKWPGMAPNGARRIFVPTNPDLADILGRTDLNCDHFYVCHFLDPNFLDFQVPRSPNSQISKFPDFQVPRFPDAAAGCGCGRTLRSRPDPYPNAPRDQIRRKGPCCDVTGSLADEV